MKCFRLLCLCSCLVFGLTLGRAPVASSLKIQLQENQDAGSVKVGLLIPKGGSGAGKWLAAKQGAEMAIAEANTRGGIGGFSIKLIVRSSEGLWGSGSKEIVKLVFEDSVWAILGSLDGRSAHLAEQIATKGQVLLISSWATDPTLTQIKIPWFFRCVPDDRQQAIALVKEIFQTRKLTRVVTIAEEVDDYKKAAISFSRVAVSNGHPTPLQLSYETANNDFRNMFRQIENAQAEGIVLFGQPLLIAELVKQLRARGMNQALFGPLSLLADNELLNTAGADLEKMVLVSPGSWFLSEEHSFQRKFRKTYGYPPTAVAAYAYDGMCLILAAIKGSGLSREKTRDILININHVQGVTGPIQFDANGSRQGPVHLLEIKKGLPVILTPGY